jgi:serine/threonine protein kinase
MLFEGLLVLGRRLLHDNRVEAAVAVFSHVREQLGQERFASVPNRAGLMRRAEEEANAVLGGKSGGRHWEFLGQSLFAETMQPGGIASWVFAGLIFSGAQAGILNRLLSSHAKVFTQGFGARALASTLAFSLEVPALVAAGRLMHAEAGSFSENLAATALMLGPLKLCGWGTAAFRQKGILGNLVHQAGMFAGILGGLHAAEFFELRSPRLGATTTTDAMATWGQMVISGSLLRGALGPKWAAFQQDLKLRSEWKFRNAPFVQTSPFASVLSKIPMATGRESVASAKGTQRPWVEMSAQDREGGPPAERRETLPSREIERGGASPSPPAASVSSVVPSARPSGPVTIGALATGTRIGPDVQIPGGQTVGRFEILGCIGAGGRGVVYKVRDDKNNGRISAVKIPRGENTPEDLARFDKEIDITLLLASGWAVTIYEYFELEPGSGIHVPLMEYVDGTSLVDLLVGLNEETHGGASGVPLEKIIDYFADLCLGIQDAHQHGLAHADLKPENLLRNAYNRARILDWALARETEGDSPQETGRRPTLRSRLRPQNETSTMEREGHEGTLSYMAPERGTSTASQNPVAWDIFSLGVILFELIAEGKNPFGVYRRGNPAQNQPALVPEYYREEYYDSGGRRKKRQRVRIDAAKAAFYGSRRDFFPPRLRDLLPGPLSPLHQALEAVALKAMAVRPEDRHSSAAELGEEVLMARVRVGQEELRQLKEQRRELDREVQSSSSQFKVTSKIDPHQWTRMHQLMNQSRQIRQSWCRKAEILISLLEDLKRYQSTMAVRRMIAETRFELLEDAGDRISQGDKTSWIRQIHDNDFALPHDPRRYFSEVVTGAIPLNLRLREVGTEIPVPEVDHIQVIPFVPEQDGEGMELGTYREGPVLMEGKLSELRNRLALPAGYYYLTFRSEGYHSMQVPLSIEPGDVYRSVMGNKSLDLTWDLVPENPVLAGMAIIQGGKFFIGLDYHEDGIPSLAYSFPLQEAEAPTFAISEKPVLIREYIPFIEDLLSQGKLEQALDYLPAKDIPRQGISKKILELTWKVYKDEGIRAAWRTFWDQLQGNIYYWRIRTTGFGPWKRHRLVDPATHLDPNGAPIYHDQPINAIKLDASYAFLEWERQRDEIPRRLPTHGEMQKVNRISFRWPFHFGYFFSPAFVISRLAFGGDFLKNAHVQPVGRHPMGPEHYRDFNRVYHIWDGLGNARGYTSDEGEHDTVMITSGSVRVPYGPLYLPSARWYAHRRGQKDDAVGAFRRVIDLPLKKPNDSK